MFHSINSEGVRPLLTHTLLLQLLPDCLSNWLETLQHVSSWSVDVHVILDFQLSFFWQSYGPLSFLAYFYNQQCIQQEHNIETTLYIGWFNIMTLNHVDMSRVMWLPTLWWFCHVLFRPFFSFKPVNQRPPCWLYGLGHFHRWLMWQEKTLIRLHLYSLIKLFPCHQSHIVGNYVMWLI